MGNTPSQEIHEGANGEPEALDLRTIRAESLQEPSHNDHPKSAEVVQRRKQVEKEVGIRAMKQAIDGDGESDWSDWEAKPSKGVNRGLVLQGDFAPTTYQTTSSSDEEEDQESGPEEQTSESDPDALLGRDGSQEPGRPSPSISKYLPAEESGKGNSSHATATRQASRKLVQEEQDSSVSEDSEEETSATNARLRDPPLTNVRSDIEELQLPSNLNSTKHRGRRPPKNQPRNEDAMPEVVARPTPVRRSLQTPPDPSTYVEESSESDEGDPREGTRTNNTTKNPQPSNSDEHAWSPKSVFDPAKEANLQGEEHLPQSGLKRKGRSTSTRATQPGEQSTRKRKRSSTFSPPTSIPSDHGQAAVADLPDHRAIRGTFKINRPAKKQRAAATAVTDDQASVSQWVKPLSKHHTYRHPLFNPSPLKHPSQGRVANSPAQNGVASGASSGNPAARSPRIYGVRRSRAAFVVAKSGEEETSAPQPRAKTVLSSPKGKSKALPGVEYSSPTKENAEGTRWSSGRSQPTRGEASSSQNGKAQGNGSEPDSREPSRDTSDAASHVDGSDADSAVASARSSDSRKHVCNECNQRFERKGHLQAHKNNNRAKPENYECCECGESYEKRQELMRHQTRSRHRKETFHPRRTGPFSEREKEKLSRYRDTFCDQRGIHLFTFNQMMMDSSRRGTDIRWPWPDITKDEFLDDYFAVLPDRNRKSMQRYRERNFHNLEHGTEWTKEDDDEIIRLVKELGPKWLEIGLRLNRTQDSVTQRYKKKLRYQDAARRGQWTSEENDALVDVISTIKNQLDLADTTDTDQHINWDEVSKRMRGTRTAQQCSTHWTRTRPARRKRQRRTRTATGDEVSSADNEEKEAIRPRKKKRRGNRTPRNVKSKMRISPDDDDEDNDDEEQESQHQERFLSVSLPKKHINRSDYVSLDSSSAPASQDQLLVQGQAHLRQRPVQVADVASALELDPPQRSQLGPANGAAAAYSEDHSSANEEAMDGGATPDDWHDFDQFVTLSPVEPMTSPNPRLDIPASQSHHDSDRPLKNGTETVSLASSRKWLSSASGPRRNLLLTKTPGKVMGLSQVFEATQAPTSALRPKSPSGLQIPPSNSKRPSPNIGIRLRKESSQYQRLRDSDELEPLPEADLKHNEEVIDNESENEGTDAGASEHKVDSREVVHSESEDEEVSDTDAPRQDVVKEEAFANESVEEESDAGAFEQDVEIKEVAEDEHEKESGAARLKQKQDIKMKQEDDKESERGESDAGSDTSNDSEDEDSASKEELLPPRPIFRSTNLVKEEEPSTKAVLIGLPVYRSTACRGVGKNGKVKDEEADEGEDGEEKEAYEDAEARSDSGSDELATEYDSSEEAGDEEEKAEVEGTEEDKAASDEEIDEDEADHDDSNDSMVKGTKNDFMASIRESAKILSKPPFQATSRWTANDTSSDESDD